MKTVYELWKKTAATGVYKPIGRHDSRETAAAHSDAPELGRWQVSGDPNDRHVDTADASWLITEEREPENDADRIDLAVDVAFEFGQIDGDHHKAWTIDQMVRVLAGERYAALIEEYRDGVDGPDTYTWDEGIAP